jgi:hypothetical protein
MRTNDEFLDLSGGSDSGSGTATISLEASDVTGTHWVRARDVEPSLPAGAVARALATRMLLPQDVTWALRDDATSVFLDDSRPIGDQIASNARLTVSPRAHLG